MSERRTSESGVGSMTPYGKLLHIAAELVRGTGLPSSFDEDSFYASTPRAERRRVLQALEDIHEQHKRWAIQIRDAADALKNELALALDEAADEIERLRAELYLARDAATRHLTAARNFNTGWKETQEERDGLRAALTLSRQWRDYYRALWLGQPTQAPLNADPTELNNGN